MARACLSDWELDELVYLRDRCRWEWMAIAAWFGLSERQLRRLYRRRVDDG